MVKKLIFSPSQFTGGELKGGRVFPFILVVLVLFLTNSTQAVPVHFTGGETFVEISSVKIKKTHYLELTEVEKVFRITVLRDSINPLLILRATRNCVPVFLLDDKDLTTKDSKEFIRASLVAEVIGAELKDNGKKKGLSFSLPPPLEICGVQPNNFAPGFALLNADSVAFSSAEELKKGGLLILFIRSAEWDPVTKDFLRTFSAYADSLSFYGVQTVAIHGYGLKQSRKWQADLKLKFPLLMDQSAAVMRGFEVFDKGNLPYSAVFLLNSEGRIVYRQLELDRNQFPNPVSLMAKFR